MVNRINRFYPKYLSNKELFRILNKISTTNIIDHPTDGDVGGQQGIQEDFTREFPAGEIQDETNTGPEFDQFKRPRQAEIGQELTQLTTERETSKTKQQNTQHGLWNKSYSDDNNFEDADLKLGENDNDDISSLEQPIYEPYTQGTGPLNSRYEDPGGKYNIILHSTKEDEEINPNKGPSQFWIAVDLDGTILEPPPGDIYEKDGKHMFGEPKPGAREAMQEMIDGGARVSVYTARTYFVKDEKDETKLITAIEELLENNNIPFTDVYVGNKPPSHCIIDDRAIRFDNDWDVVLDTVRDKLNKKEAQVQFTADDLTRLYELEYKIDQLNRRKTEAGGWIEDSIQNKILQWEEELRSLVYKGLEKLKKIFSDWIIFHSESSWFIRSEDVPEEIRQVKNQELKELYKQHQKGEIDKPWYMVTQELDEKYMPAIADYMFSNLEPYVTIKNINEELKQYPVNDLDSNIAMFNIALNTVHKGGKMIDWWHGITEEDLNDLTAGKYISEWDNELSKIANDPVKDTVNFQGIDIDIEWPKGSIRSYEGDDTYVTHMKVDYGYARGVEGNDGEELDIYLADRESTSPVAFIIEQLDDEGNYDEDKIVLGVESEGEAADIYLEHMPSYALGDVRKVPIEKLRNALYGKPEDRRGQEDLVPSEEKKAMIRKISSYSDIAVEAIEKANITPLTRLILQYIDPNTEYTEMVNQLVRAMLTDENLKEQIEQLLGKQSEYDYSEFNSKDIEQALGPTGTQKIIQSVIKHGTKTWPEDDIFENEFTDSTEDRENRDIPRPNEKERSTYRNALKVSL